MHASRCWDFLLEAGETLLHSFTYLRISVGIGNVWYQVIRIHNHVFRCTWSCSTYLWGFDPVSEMANSSIIENSNWLSCCFSLSHWCDVITVNANYLTSARSSFYLNISVYFDIDNESRFLLFHIYNLLFLSIHAWCVAVEATTP